MSLNTAPRVVRPAQDKQRLILPVVLLFAGVLIVVLTPFQVIDAETDPVGPRFLPYLTGAAVALGGLADLIIQLRAGHQSFPTESNAAAAPTDSEPGSLRSLVLSLALILVGILIWVYTTVYLGYAVTSLILMGLTAAAFGLRKPVQLAVLLVVTVGLTYVVFAELLQVQLTLIGR